LLKGFLKLALHSLIGSIPFLPHLLAGLLFCLFAGKNTAFFPIQAVVYFLFKWDYMLKLRTPPKHFTRVFI
jgi:hypothetical protein